MKGKEERKMNEMRKKEEVLLVPSKQNLKESKEKRGKKMKRESTYLEDCSASDGIYRLSASSAAISRSEIFMVFEVIFPNRATNTNSSTLISSRSQIITSLTSQA
jgi:hypothetical protein